MTLIDLPSVIEYPPQWQLNDEVSLSGTYAGALIDADGERVGSVFPAPKTGSIDQIHFRTGTVTTGATVDVRVESLDLATGYPSGNLYGANTNVSQAILDADDNKWFECTLTSGASVTRGDGLAALVAAPTGFAGNLYLTIVQMASELGQFARDHYPVQYASAAWGKKTTPLCMRVRYAGSPATFPVTPGLMPFYAIAEATVGPATDPDEVGLKIYVPFGCRIAGFWASLEADQDCQVKLCDAAGDPIAGTTVTVDKDWRYGDTHQAYWRFFGTPYTLSAPGYVHLLFSPQAASCGIRYVSVSSTAHWEQFGWGADLQWREKTDGVWDSPIATQRMLGGLLIDQLDNGAGGGGLKPLGVPMGVF